MRIFTLTALVLFLGTTVSMAGPISKEMADSYYLNCLSKESAEGLSKENQNSLCACTASKMMDNMVTEDIQDMNSQDPKVARGAMNHMIVKVYAPCMEFPAQDHYYNSCIANPKTSGLSKNPKALCECMSNKVADYLKENGEDVFEDILRRSPNIADPMQALENDSKFQNYVGKQVLSCVL